MPTINYALRRQRKEWFVGGTRTDLISLVKLIWRKVSQCICSLWRQPSKIVTSISRRCYIIYYWLPAAPYDWDRQFQWSLPVFQGFPHSQQSLDSRAIYVEPRHHVLTNQGSIHQRRSQDQPRQQHAPKFHLLVPWQRFSLALSCAQKAWPLL